MQDTRGEPRGNSLFAYLSRANKRERERLAGPYFRRANNTDMYSRVSRFRVSASPSSLRRRTPRRVTRLLAERRYSLPPRRDTASSPAPPDTRRDAWPPREDYLALGRAARIINRAVIMAIYGRGRYHRVPRSRYERSREYRRRGVCDRYYSSLLIVPRCRATLDRRS